VLFRSKKQYCNVRKAITRALGEIFQNSPELKPYLKLKKNIHTGNTCFYKSDKDHPVAWELY
jgi:hypothetical protein